MFSTAPWQETVGTEYIYEAVGGAGVTIYIIDFGFNLDHDVRILLFFQLG